MIILSEEIAIAVAGIRKKFHLTPFEIATIENVLTLVAEEKELTSGDLIWTWTANLLKGCRDKNKPVIGWDADNLNEFAHAIFEIYERLSRERNEAETINC